MPNYSGLGRAFSELGDLASTHFAYLDKVKEEQRQRREDQAAREQAATIADQRERQRMEQQDAAITKREQAADQRRAAERDADREDRQAEADRLAKEKAAEKLAKDAADAADLEARANLIPEGPARQRFRAMGGKGTVTENDFKDQGTIDSETQHANALKVQLAGQEELARRRAMQATPMTPVTPMDDPSLPNGVKQYIADIATRYQAQTPTSSDPNRAPANAAQAAHRELTAASASLYKDHPRLDMVKANNLLLSMMGSSTALMNRPDPMADLGLDGASAPQTAPPAAPPVSTPTMPIAPPRPTAPAGRGAGAPPVTTAPRAPIVTPQAPIVTPGPKAGGTGGLETEARGLIDALKQATDPGQQQSIKTRLMAIRKQLAGGG